MINLILLIIVHIEFSFCALSAYLHISHTFLVLNKIQFHICKIKYTFSIRKKGYFVKWYTNIFKPCRWYSDIRRLKTAGIGNIFRAVIWTMDIVILWFPFIRYYSSKVIAGKISPLDNIGIIMF